MTHEGRMQRGEENLKTGKKRLLNNEDTKYFLANKKEDKPKPNKPKPKKKEEVKE